MMCFASAADAQTSRRDLIGEWISGGRQKTTKVADAKAPTTPGAPSAKPRDPREGDATYAQAKRLMEAIDNILKDTAKNRTDARKLPSKGDFILTPMWTETREDRERLIRELLDAALGIVTDVPVVDVQKRIEKSRKNIRDLEKLIADYREKQVTAPRDSLLPGVIADTVDTLGQKIKDAEKRIAENKKDIDKAKGEIKAALDKSGIKLSPEQVEMLLGSVLSGDLVRLVAVFNSARQIDQQLARRMAATGENMEAARKYFAMHAALFAMLVHAQDTVIAKIDTKYLPKLNAILGDLRAAGRKTERLLRAQNRPDQRRVLEANRRSQKLAERAAEGYRRYLIQQREQVAQARRRAAHDLSIADNTYETVEASFQLRNLMKSTRSTFEALQKLRAPTFDQIFKNEELRREFENLTKKLEVPTG
ncbi:MAG: hypothetical protein KDJ36_05955 [Hyphomicrobiaceae bacterium]|nr:hypothetical protein [Hyphomicrobiaceae bacterium]